AIDQSIPALAYPIRRWRMSPDAQQVGPPEITWLIIELNPNVLRKEILPEPAQKYFGGSSGMEYYVAVRAAGKNGEHAFYSSGAGFGEEQNLPVDATLNLAGPPFGQGGPRDTGVEFFSAPMRPMPGDHGPQADEQHLAGLDRTPRFEPFHYAGRQGVWQVTAKHKSGSVEAAVGALRRRNLMA